jgi:hypothetical protein
MAFGNWAILSIVFWIFGFFEMKILEPTPESKLVYTPKWIYILLGAPKHQGIPHRVVPVASVGLQIMGITMALYGLFIDQRLILDKHLSAFVGIMISLLVGAFLAQLLIRKQPYKMDK